MMMGEEEEMEDVLLLLLAIIFFRHYRTRSYLIVWGPAAAGEQIIVRSAELPAIFKIRFLFPPLFFATPFIPPFPAAEEPPKQAPYEIYEDSPIAPRPRYYLGR
jgi:hypothetical protein